MNAVDTNVFIYSLDADEPAKQIKAMKLLGELADGSGETILLWQVAAELLSHLRRWEARARITESQTKKFFTRFRGLFPVHLPTEAVLATSFALSQNFSLSHWDSLLLAACHEAGVTTLFSEDLDHETDYAGLRVVNPFA